MASSVHPRIRPRLSTRFAAAALAAGLAGPGAAWAADAAAGIGSGRWGVQYGSERSKQRLTLSYETAPLWQARFALGRVEVVGEMDVSYWRAQRDPLPGYARSMWQVGATPMLRWWPLDAVYLEAGIGATLVSEHRLMDKDITTTFLFGDHVGAGIQFGRHTRLGLRVSHFSNAGIKKPNQGLNAFQVTLSTRF